MLLFASCVLFCLTNPLLLTTTPPGMGYSLHPESRSSSRSQSAKFLVEDIRIQGNHRVKTSTIKERLVTREGDTVDESQLRRDLESLYALGDFKDISVSTEEGTHGGRIILFNVTERPVIMLVQYVGLSQKEMRVVNRELKKTHIDLSIGNAHDPHKAELVTEAIQRVLMRSGHRDATVDLMVKEFPGNRVGLSFNVSRQKQPSR